MTAVRRRRLLQSALAAAVLGASGLASRPARAGGVLQAALSGGSAADSWDPRRPRGMFMVAASQGAVFDTLTEVAADGTLKGELATGWEASPDARRWTVTLRDGVSFHNGRRLTAEDVLASLALHREPASPAHALVSGIEEMRAISPRDLRFTLRSGNADFPYLLADPHLVILPADDMAEAMARGIGTGLYRVERFDAGRRFIGTRVTEHWKDGSAGWFDRVDFLALADPEARLRALAEGRVDAADALPPAALATLDSDPRLRLIRQTGNLQYGFAADPGLDSADLRLALKHAMDRPRLVTEVLGGYGQPGRDTPIGPANPYFSGATPPAHDPDRARFHLRRAGLEGFPLPVSAAETAFPGAAQAADLLGETLPLRPACPGDPALRALISPGRATEDWSLSMAPAACAPCDGSRARFDTLLQTARAEFDSARRAELYAELQMMGASSGGLILPMAADHLQGLSRRLATPATQGALWQMDDARMAERWWIA